MTKKSAITYSRGPGRPRRRTPAERIHVTLGCDVMEALRKDVANTGMNYSHLIEKLLISYFQRKSQQHKQEIV